MSTTMTERQLLISDYLTTPKTLNEIAKNFHISYHTVWRELTVLVDIGFVKEAPWRRGREKQFVVSGAVTGGIIQIITPGGNRTLTQLISREFSEEARSGVRGALSQIWRFCTFTRQPEQLHLAGSMSPAEVKPYVRELLDFYKNMQLVCEQLLLADIWTDSVETAEKFGPVDVPVALEQGEAFEKRHGR